MNKLEYRSIFISDVHLGTKDCQAEYLLDFLDNTQSEYLYLVGDIFDIWSMKKSVHWTKAQSAVVRKVFEKASTDTKVIYIPGNHDELFREFCGTEVRNIPIMRDAVHTTVDGRRFFVSHGDEFDGIVKHNQIVKAIGDWAYYFLLFMNRQTTRLRARMGRPYWSLSSFLKTQVKNAREYIEKFQNAAAMAADQGDYDGYICGHIHKAGIENINGKMYCNDGDWVEHCTALVEDHDGDMHLLHWSDHARVEAVSCGEAVEVQQLPVGIAALQELASLKTAA